MEKDKKDKLFKIFSYISIVAGLISFFGSYLLLSIISMFEDKTDFSGFSFPLLITSVVGLILGIISMIKNGFGKGLLGIILNFIPLLWLLLIMLS